jgi:hypothetical protein
LQTPKVALDTYEILLVFRSLLWQSGQPFHGRRYKFFKLFLTLITDT